MKFEYWLDDVEAKACETLLVDRLIAATEYSENRRIAFHEDTFSQVRQVLGLSIGSGQNLVLRNINPYLRLFETGEHKALLKAMHDRLPLCGEGYFHHADGPTQANIPHMVMTRSLPSTHEVITALGSDSPLFRMASARDVAFYVKGYGDKYDYSIQSLKACRDRMLHPDFDFTHVHAWMDRAINSREVIPVIIELAGLGTLIANEDPHAASQAFITRTQEKERAASFASLILELLSNKNHRHVALSLTTRIDLLQETEESYGLYKTRIRNLVMAFEQFDPQKAKYLRGDLIRSASEMNMGWEGNDLMRDSMRSLYTFDELKGHVRKNDALSLTNYLDMPRLLEMTSGSAKRKHLSDGLGL